MRATIAIRACLGLVASADGAGLAYVLVDQEPGPAWLSAGGERRTAIVSRALMAGLRLATPSDDTVYPAPGCRASYRGGVFAVTSVRLGGALVDPMALDAPPGWVRAARENEGIGVMVGDDIVHLRQRPGDKNFEFLTPAAERGALALGTVPFSG